MWSSVPPKRRSACENYCSSLLAPPSLQNFHAQCRVRVSLSRPLYRMRHGGRTSVQGSLRVKELGRWDAAKMEGLGGRRGRRLKNNGKKFGFCTLFYVIIIKKKSKHVNHVPAAQQCPPPPGGTSP